MNTRQENAPPPEDVEIIRIQHPTSLLSGNAGPPSNDQIIGAVEATKKVIEEQIETNKQLDETGKKIAVAADKVLQTTEDLIEHKNRDQKIQKFLQHAIDFGKKFKEEAQKQSGKDYLQNEDVQKGIEKFKKLGEHIRNLLRELVTSSEFKSLLQELVEIFEKIFSKFSKKVNLQAKAKEGVEGTIQAASSLGKKEGSSSHHETKESTETLKEKAKETGQEIKEAAQDSKETFKEKLKETDQEIKEAAKDSTETLKEKVKETGQEIKETTKDSKETLEEKAKETGQEIKEAAKDSKETLKGKAKETGQEIKEAAKETSDEISKEEKENLNQSVRKLLSKIGSNKQYKQLSQEFFSLWDFLNEKKEETLNNDATEKLRQEFRDLYDEAASVVSEFVGRKDMKDLEKKFWDFYGQILEDEKIRSYFRDLRKWSQKLLDDPTIIEDKEVINDAQDFIDRGGDLIKGKPEELFREVIDDFKSTLKSLQEDKYALALKESFQDVQEAFEGSIFQALSQTRVLAIPILKEMMKEIPLPKIIGRTSDTAYTIDNLVLQGREITLDDITFEINFGTKEVMELIIKINKIEGTLRSAHFTYLSSGLFDWEDEGTFSCVLTSPRWKLKWIIQETNDQPLRLRLVKVDGTIDKLDIQIEEARHKFLDRVSLALFSGEIKRKTSVVAENALRHQAQLLTQKFNEFFLQQHFYSGSSDQDSQTESHNQTPATQPLPPLL